MKIYFKSRIERRYTWDRLSVNFLFIPGIMAVGAVVLALLMYRLDVLIPNEVLAMNRLIVSGSVDELRSNLFGMALAVLTTAGIVFTLLTLPLSTVAAQYGSRLLRMFLADHTTQFVLGMFVATFVYCVTGALIIPSAQVSSQGPQLTATTGLYLLVASFAMLILLIQHISIMLQAPAIAAAAGAELIGTVKEANREIPPAGEDRNISAGSSIDSLREGEAHPIRSSGSGYIQYIDLEDILSLTEKHELFIRIVHKPGDFVRNGLVIALVWPGNRITGDLDKEIGKTYHLGHQRTPTQDIEYAVNQLSEMALRAMSPAINDPFTAMTCLDYIGNGLALYARQGAISPHIYDAHGKLRLVYDPFTFDQLLTAAFEMLRHASADNAGVLLHMLQTIAVIGQETKSLTMQASLLHQVELIREESQAGALIEADRQSISQRSEALLYQLKTPS